MLEGETVLILGAVAAKLGMLKLWLVILVALAGSFTGDQIYFWLGRRYGPQLLARWPSWRMRVSRVTALLETYDAWFILGFRFAYGLRSISPFVIGMSGVSTARFIVFNFLAALLWAVVVGFASYVLGAAIETLLADVQHAEGYIIAAVIAGGVMFWLLHLWRVRARTRRYLSRNADSHQ